MSGDAAALQRGRRAQLDGALSANEYFRQFSPCVAAQACCGTNMDRHTAARGHRSALQVDEDRAAWRREQEGGEHADEACDAAGSAPAEAACHTVLAPARCLARHRLAARGHVLFDRLLVACLDGCGERDRVLAGVAGCGQLAGFGVWLRARGDVQGRRCCRRALCAARGRSGACWRSPGLHVFNEVCAACAADLAQEALTAYSRWQMLRHVRVATRSLIKKHTMGGANTPHKTLQSRHRGLTGRRTCCR